MKKRDENFQLFMLEGAKRSILTVLTFVSASCFGRFLGSEGIERIAWGRNLVLFGILFFSLILLFRQYYFHLNRKYGSRVVCIIYISLICFTSLFCYCIRIYLLSHIGFFFSDVLTVLMGTCAVSGSGGEVIPHSENFKASSSEATSVGQVPNRNGAGPSNPGPREYNSPWESFPSVPSDLQPLPADSVPSVPSLPSLGSDFEVMQPAPQPNELERLRNHIHSIIQEQVRKQCDRKHGPISHMQNQREINSKSAWNIMNELEIPMETDPRALQNWINRIQTDESLLKPLIKEYI